MEAVRVQLQQEFIKRTAKNSKYSLRAFSTSLKLNHATLSGILSGRRKISLKTATHLSKVLGWSPAQMASLVSDVVREKTYSGLANDTFARISDWYFDAILECTRIPQFPIDATSLAKTLKITALQARLALETLFRLGMLEYDKKKRPKLTQAESTNILDSDFTTSAQIAHQKQVLEKSIEALEIIDQRRRDHSSVTMAMNKKDLAEVRRRICAFRRELDQYLQRSGQTPNTVYQLQMSFFPLIHKEVSSDD